MRHYTLKLKNLSLTYIDAAGQQQKSREKDKMAAMSIITENLIEAMRMSPCLYDTTMMEYKDDLLREKAWKAICVELHVKEYDGNELHVKGKDK